MESPNSQVLRQTLDGALQSYTYQVERRIEELESQAALWKAK